MNGLKLQTGFTCGIGKRLDTTVILIMTTIELCLSNTGFHRLLGDYLTNDRRSVTVATVLNLIADRFITSARTDDRFSGQVVDDLTREVHQRPVDAQPGLIGIAAELVTNAASSTQTLALNFFVLIHLLVSY